LANFPGTQVLPLYYILEIDDDSTFASVDYVDSGLVQTTHETTQGLADGEWYWRVSAVNDTGRATGYYEPYRRFLLDGTPPALPDMISPLQDDTVSYESQQFVWSAVDKGTPVSYELLVSSDSTFAAAEISEPSLDQTTYQTSGVLLPDMTYYWQVRPYDAVGNSPGFTDYIRFHTERDFICGDVDGNELVNVSDIVSLIAFVFGTGSPPDPLEAGDVTCEGTVNVTDIVYLISFVFGDGPEPCADCP
jgi:hypothetical protein